MSDEAANAHREYPAKLRDVRRRFATFRAISALVIREMTTTYGRSPGGYIWAILEPAAGIAVLSVIFAAGFRTPQLGTDFAIFFASGMMPFMLYMDIVGKTGQSLQFSRQLLAYPAVTFIDALLARFILALLTQLLVSYIIISGIIYFFQSDVTLNMPKIALSMAMAAFLGLGIGTLNCFLGVRFPLWIRIWAIANRPLFLISGIIILFDTIPEPYRGWLWYNPLIHVTGLARAGYYPYYRAEYVEPLYVFAIGAVALVLGLLFLRRYHREILFR